MDDELIIFMVIMGMFIFWINFKPSQKQETKLKSKTSPNESIIKFVLDLKSISRAKFINKYADEDTIETVEELVPILNKRSMRKIIKLRNEIHNKKIRFEDLKADPSITFDESYWVKSSLKRDKRIMKAIYLGQYYNLFDTIVRGGKFVFSDTKSEEDKIKFIKQSLDPISIVEILFLLDELQKDNYLDLLVKTYDLKLVEIFKKVATELKWNNHLRKTLNAYEKNLN